MPLHPHPGSSHTNPPHRKAQEGNNTEPNSYKVRALSLLLIFHS